MQIERSTLAGLLLLLLFFGRKELPSSSFPLSLSRSTASISAAAEQI